MSALTKSEYQALLRSDPYAFFQRAFYEINPQTKFKGNWHIEQIAAKLEACRLGKIKRLIINIPPRSLKSICASVAFPAWLLGKDPAAQIMCVSYAQDLADKHARDCRAVMSADWYQGLFPTQLSADRNAVQEFVTTEQGYRLATSVGGVLTGRGADYIIIDDPLKPEEALSETQRNAANEWFSHTLYSRLNDKSTGCIIIIMQRLHEDDLVGHVLAQEDWNVVSFPAIAERDEEIVIDTAFGAMRVQRRAGDLLHPERESRADLDQIRKTLSEYHFSGQYQQAPAPRGGGMVKEAWFKRYGSNELPDKFDRVIQSWDTANKPGDLNDYSVCTTWGIKDKRIYLLNVFRKKLDYPGLKRAVQDQFAAYDPGVILIEDKASGTQLIQEMREAGIHAVTAYKSKFDKVMRLDAQTGVIENGLVYIPTEVHWLAEYLHELSTFPKSKHDDQVDSTSQALEWLKQRVPGWGILEYYRLAVEEMKMSTMRMVTLKVSAGTSHVQTITGRSVMVRGDGSIEVSEEEAGPLCAIGYIRL
jgi:predicted phage terminase large subunit-like protein